MHAMNRRGAILPISDPELRCKLFDSRVLPIMSYAGEVWGVDEKLGAAAELLHRQCLMHILGVRDSTAYVMVLAVLGHNTLAIAPSTFLICLPVPKKRVGKCICGRQFLA